MTTDIRTEAAAVIEATVNTAALTSAGASIAAKAFRTDAERIEAGEFDHLDGPALRRLLAGYARQAAEYAEMVATLAQHAATAQVAFVDQVAAAVEPPAGKA